MITSGVRLGTPVGTTRGFGVFEFEQIGDLISDVLDGLVTSPFDNSDIEQKVRHKVGSICARFPISSKL